MRIVCGHPLNFVVVKSSLEALWAWMRLINHSVNLLGHFIKRLSLVSEDFFLSLVNSCRDESSSLLPKGIISWTASVSQSWVQEGSWWKHWILIFTYSYFLFDDLDSRSSTACGDGTSQVRIERVVFSAEGLWIDLSRCSKHYLGTGSKLSCQVCYTGPYNQKNSTRDIITKAVCSLKGISLLVLSYIH